MRSLGEQCRSFSLVSFLSSGAKIILYRDSATEYCENTDMKKVLKKPQLSQPLAAEAANRLRFFTERKDIITETIRQLVEIESPSDNKQAIDELGALLAGRFEGLGGHSKFHRAQDFGDHLQVDFEGAHRGRPVLLL